MTAAGRFFASFDTAIGRCAIAWGSHGILAVHLPERDGSARADGLQPSAPGAQLADMPPSVQAVVDDITALLAGRPRDLRAAVLDMQGLPAFHCRVYELARGIPPGETTTYGGLAARLGEPGAARAVGQAMGSNPFPLIVPCHRVLPAGGGLGGFSLPGGAATKRRLLEIERAPGFETLPLFGDRPA
jgi:methylated-DNA-[protein]-cysteine S-methyltransferase